MRRIVMSLALALIVAGAASFMIVPTQPTRAAGQSNVFIIPPSDGYGVADCIAGGHECGKIVANAWCESKGFKVATAFGAASPADITGSVGSRAQAPQEPALVITCGE
jgi:hypothetical protein